MSDLGHVRCLASLLVAIFLLGPFSVARAAKAITVVGSIGEAAGYTVLLLANDGSFRSVEISDSGKFVNGIREADGRKGYLCLEAEGAEVHFRKVRIMELPAGRAEELEMVLGDPETSLDIRGDLLPERAHQGFAKKRQGSLLVPQG